MLTVLAVLYLVQAVVVAWTVQGPSTPYRFYAGLIWPCILATVIAERAEHEAITAQAHGNATSDHA